MAVMKVKDFIEKLKHIETLPTTYYSVAGGDWAKWNGSSWNFDCVILVKAILWGWNENKNASHGGAIYGSNGVYDDTPSQMINRCYNVSGDFNVIKEGELLYTDGHVGVYVGNGEVIECTTGWGTRRVIVSNIDNAGRRIYNGQVNPVGWKLHGELPYIEYSSEPIVDDRTERIKVLQDTLNKQYNCGLAVDGSFGPLTSQACLNNYLYEGKNAPLHISWMQDRLIKLGYSCGGCGIDGSFGPATLSALMAFQADRHLSVDGYCGSSTSWELVK